jgi:hypothetical protein
VDEKQKVSQAPRKSLRNKKKVLFFNFTIEGALDSDYRRNTRRE